MRRNTKTMYEWRKAYRDKEELMLERGFPEVSPYEFYRDVYVLIRWYVKGCMRSRGYY